MAKAATKLRPVEAVADRAELPDIVVKHLRVTVRGIKPLLTHNPASMSATSANDAKRGTRVPKPEVEAEAGVYRMEDGTCALKGEAFRGALVSAAGAWKIKRGTATRIVAHIMVVEELVPLKRADGTPIKDYTIDARRAIVQRQGVLRHRPRFDEWTCSFTIEYDPQLIADPEMLIGILNDGGNRIGVGDFRPGRNGPYGRFRITDWDAEDED